MSNELKRTVLHSTHLKLGAQMTPFGGWDMPVRYSGDIAEHKSVRERAGIFDVSHMGRFAVRGKDAQAFLDRMFTNHVAALKIGQAHYGFLCNHSGGVVDDVICYRRGEDFYWLVVNAGNRDKDWQWLVSHPRGEVDLQNVSDEWALLALQGPHALTILARFTSLDFTTIPYYHCADTQVAEHEALIARTGYTGEDGVEIAVRSEWAAELWMKLLEAGATPCGLGARDTLRLEAGMALYGHELTDTTNPLAANLKRFIKLDKRASATGALDDFVGRDWLEQSLKDGLQKKLVGLVMVERGIARAGYKVQMNGQVIGELTSGGPSITTGQNIALAYVPVEHSKVDTVLEVIIRDKPVKAKVVKLPFYARKK